MRKVSFQEHWPDIQGPVSESAHTFLGPKSCFMFVVFVFKIKVSIILKMIY